MFRIIAVHLDNGVDCQRRLAFAIQLARHHRARLTGIYTPRRQLEPVYYGETVALARISDMLRDLYQSETRAAETAFHETMAQSGLEYQWRCRAGYAADTLALHARCADVLVVSQEDRGDTGSQARDGVIEQVLITGGRPVLMLPMAGDHAEVGRHVLYCWNRSRESARALADAAPVLASATELTVLTMKDRRTEAAEAEVRFEDLSAFCQAHGYPLPRHDRRETTDVGVGETILNAASDCGADLIVMGAFGQSRLREWAMGGATAALLQSMTVPVLFSH